MAKWKRYPFTASRFRFHKNLPISPLRLPASASASTSLVTTLSNAAFYPTKTSKRLKLPRIRSNFCQISIVRQHTKYKDYKPIQKCEDVNISVYCCSQITACYCYIQLDYSYVAYILMRFLCSTGSPESSIYFSTLTPTPAKSFFDSAPTPDYGKTLFSTLTLTPTSCKNLRFPRL